MLLVLIEDIKDQMPHVFDVGRCGLSHERVSCGREDRAVKASVGRIGLSADEATLLQAANEMRQSRKLGIREDRELAHPQCVIGLLRKACQDVVLEEAQIGVAPELVAQDGREARQDVVQRPPGLSLVRSEPRDPG